MTIGCQPIEHDDSSHIGCDCAGGSYGALA
jgi:hypothetical protein